MADLIEISEIPGLRLIDAYDITKLVVAINSIYQGLLNVRIATLSPVTIHPTDNIVIIDLTTPGPAIIRLYGGAIEGSSCTIKDGSGTVFNNNNTITTLDGSTIDGQASYVQNSNYQSNTFMYNGTQWNVI